jgi:chaperonin cofactor prefoldin
MEVLPAAINAVVVAAVGLILGWLGKGRIDKLEARIDRLEERLDGRIDRFEERIDARFDSLRSDLTRIALAVGVRPEAEAGGG